MQAVGRAIFGKEGTGTVRTPFRLHGLNRLEAGKPFNVACQTLNQFDGLFAGQFPQTSHQRFELGLLHDALQTYTNKAL